MKRIYIPPVVSLSIIALVSLGATALILNTISKLSVEQTAYIQSANL